MGKSFAQIIGEIKEGYNATLDSLVGGEVIGRISPANETGVMHCFVFDNGVVLEVGVPFYVFNLDSRVSHRIDYTRKHPTKIIEGSDIYSLSELRERLEFRRNYPVDDLGMRFETKEVNDALIAYYAKILRVYEEYRRKARGESKYGKTEFK